jgi:hypothetical protein
MATEPSVVLKRVGHVELLEPNPVLVEHAKQRAERMGRHCGGHHRHSRVAVRRDSRPVHVGTNESFAGAPVEADASSMQSRLDGSLAAWLGHLKAAAESKA